MVALLAGGQGERIRSVAGDLPKALLPVAGRPFLAWKLDELADAGAASVVLLTGSGHDLVREYLATADLPLRVEVRPDGPVLLGTGGALKAALPCLPDRFLVMFADTLQTEPVLPMWTSYLAGVYPAMMAVTKQMDSNGFGNVDFDGERVVRYSKANPTAGLQWLDYGYLAISADLLSSATQSAAFDLGEMCADLALDGRLGGWAANGPFHEIGTPTAYRLTLEHLGGAVPRPDIRSVEP